MRDKEIIKALEYCTSNYGSLCSYCPKYDKMNDFCQEELLNYALDLIQRQQIEIDIIQEFYETQYDQTIKAAKYEAVKEFATRLEEYSYESMGNYGISCMVVSVKDIDNLVKEMEKKYEIS